MVGSKICYTAIVLQKKVFKRLGGLESFVAVIKIMMQRMFYIKYSRKSRNFEQRKTAARYFFANICMCKMLSHQFCQYFWRGRMSGWRSGRLSAPPAAVRAWGAPQPLHTNRIGEEHRLGRLYIFFC